MTKVFSSPYISEVGWRKELLEHNGIQCIIRNENVSSVVVGFHQPLAETWPELWVLLDADAPVAEQLLNNPPEADPDDLWKCPACGEEVEGQFTAYWNCLEPKPDTASS